MLEIFSVFVKRLSKPDARLLAFDFLWRIKIFFDIQRIWQIRPQNSLLKHAKSSILT